LASRSLSSRIRQNAGTRPSVGVISLCLPAPHPPGGPEEIRKCLILQGLGERTGECQARSGSCSESSASIPAGKDARTDIGADHQEDFCRWITLSKTAPPRKPLFPQPPPPPRIGGIRSQRSEGQKSDRIERCTPASAGLVPAGATTRWLDRAWFFLIRPPPGLPRRKQRLIRYARLSGRRSRYETCVAAAEDPTRQP